MKHVPLTQGYFAIVDDADYELVTKHNWCINQHARYKNKYARRKIPKGHQTMHQLIIGSVPKGMQIDHKNGNGLDNRRENLRIASLSENRRNLQVVRASSGFKGVSFVKRDKSYRSKINFQKKPYVLGYFKDPVEAAEAYDKAAIRLHGEFAKTNKDLGRYEIHAASVELGLTEKK